MASCAFVLSLDALRALAITLGLPVAIAWLWPCVIDVAIAQATLCLLSLHRRSVTVIANHPPAQASSRGHESAAESNCKPARPRTEVPTPDNIGDDPGLLTVQTGGVRRWQPVAESLVREGVTPKDPQFVAIILAQSEAGVPPSTTGRHHRVHHTTVGRILLAAEELTA